MADNNPDWELGEYRGHAETEAVKYGEDLSAGDPLKIVGYDSDGIAEVEKQTGATDCRYVALYDGKDGEYKQALCRGVVKVTFGAAVALGGGVAVKGGKFNVDSVSGGSNACGYLKTTAIAAADDTGIIYFDGGMQN